MDLPIELIRDIFELAAAANVAHNLAWVARLTLVCRAVRDWVRPILYHTLCIDQHNQDAFFDLLREKPSGFFAVVRHLVLTWALPPNKLSRKFYNTFQHVRIVSMHSRYLDLLSRARNFRPTHVFFPYVLFVHVLVGFSETPWVLSGVTHLRFRTQNINQSGLWLINGLMPALTHVCLDIAAGLQELELITFKEQLVSFLAAANCTRVVVRYTVRSDDNWASMFATLRSLNDTRVYLHRVGRHERSLEDETDWLKFYAAETRAGVDPWSGGKPVCTSVTRLASGAA